MKNNKVKIKSYYRKVNTKDLENLRIELYGIITEIILSKELFKQNLDIKELLNVLDLEYKDYVFRNRTMIIARVIRDIEKIEDENQLKTFYNKLGTFLFKDVYKTKTKSNKSKPNTIDDVLSQFNRGGRN